jgi:hypothetical protein
MTTPENFSKLVQIISHAGDIYALNDQGELFMRSRDPKDFNQGPQGRPIFIWHTIPGPHAPLE